MRLFVLTALTMCAFAANSVLNRMAIVGQGMDPLDFTAIRLAAGAVALWVLVRLSGKRLVLNGRPRWAGATTLLVYMVGFSLAYLALGAGVGALILFGSVQITMFAGALLAREVVPLRRWLGAGIAMAGLIWLLWPHEAQRLAVLPALSMAVAGAGWGLYSLAGRREADPLAGTAANFLLAAPVAALAALIVPAPVGNPGLTLAGVGLALLSGIVTSGLGYALWYRLLPALGATRAGVAQLTVPVIAAAGGLALLGERPDAVFLVASVLVLGGVGLSVLPGRRWAERGSGQV